MNQFLLVVSARAAGQSIAGPLFVPGMFTNDRKPSGAIAPPAPEQPAVEDYYF